MLFRSRLRARERVAATSSRPAVVALAVAALRARRVAFDRQQVQRRQTLGVLHVDRHAERRVLLVAHEQLVDRVVLRAELLDLRGRQEQIVVDAHDRVVAERSRDRKPVAGPAIDEIRAIIQALGSAGYPGDGGPLGRGPMGRGLLVIFIYTNFSLSACGGGWYVSL